MKYKDTVVFFVSDWCNPCKETKKYLRDNYLNGNYVLLDVTKNERYSHSMKVVNIPVAIKFDSEGNEVKRYVGYNPERIDNILM